MIGSRVDHLAGAGLEFVADLLLDDIDLRRDELGAGSAVGIFEDAFVGTASKRQADPSAVGQGPADDVALRGVGHARRVVRLADRQAIAQLGPALVGEPAVWLGQRVFGQVDVLCACGVHVDHQCQHSTTKQAQAAHWKWAPEQIGVVGKHRLIIDAKSSKA